MTIAVGQIITAEDILAALGGGTKLSNQTLSANSWSTATYDNQTVYYYRFSHSDIKSDSVIEICPSTTATAIQRLAFQNCYLVFKTQTTGYIDMWCFGEKPLIDIPVDIVIQ